MQKAVKLGWQALIASAALSAGPLHAEMITGMRSYMSYDGTAVDSEDGRVLYREEGKAMTGELVRRLDKGVFPRGTHTLTVVAKDFAITQRFTIE